MSGRAKLSKMERLSRIADGVMRGSRGGRIALLHYTVSPAIGGIEQLIAAQHAVLKERGCEVRLICGRGNKPAGGELIRLPELHPAHPSVRRAAAALGDALPAADHPLVTRIADSVRWAISDCDQCWVHNAFTVFLHPFLTIALRRLVGEMPSVVWVAWCEDISSVSAFWRRSRDVDAQGIGRALSGVTYVTISRARQAELSRTLSISPARITVIPPPLDHATWLRLGSAALTIARRLSLETADPVVLVPSKLLPHKNLDLAVRVARELQLTTTRPAILITGAHSPHEARISRRVRSTLSELAGELGVQQAIHFLPDVLGRPLSHRTVRDIMLLCDLVLLPSAEEGFGMPIREAASLRVPVVCAGIPALRETGGQFARYYDLVESPGSIAERVREVNNLPVNQARREALESRGRFRDDIARLLCRIDTAGREVSSVPHD